MDTCGPAGPVILGPPAAGASARNEQEQAGYGYLEALRRNGLMIPEEVTSMIDGQVTAFISVPGDGSWSAVHSSCYVERELACVLEWSGRRRTAGTLSCRLTWGILICHLRFPLFP